MLKFPSSVFSRTKYQKKCPATRTEALYLAAKETPELKTVKATIETGLQDARILSSKMPDDAAMLLTFAGERLLTVGFFHSDKVASCWWRPNGPTA